MYVDIVKLVLEEAVDLYASDSGMTVQEVLTKIREHIDNTSREHRADEPTIEYDDPLCRLGYLYRHATANATLFEWVLKESGTLRKKLRDAIRGRIQICSVGGGPGTELLGLAKYLLAAPYSFPRKISFAVLDRVPQWADTWLPLADAVEKNLTSSEEGANREAPVIAANFMLFDVLNEESYKTYLQAFRKVDIFVFNYLFSENKAQLADAIAAIKHLAKVAQPGCAFVVIDRLENDRQFSTNVANVFTGAGFALPSIHDFSGKLDSDEQTGTMGETLRSSLGVPRTKFFTQFNRRPTVFWFEVTKV